MRNLYLYSLQMTEDLKRFETQIARLGADAGITNVYQYLLQLESIIFSEDVGRDLFEDLTPFYRHVLQEYKEFKNFFISVHESSLSPGLDEIKIAQFDEKDRRHTATISVDFAKFEAPFVLVEYDLPDLGTKTYFEPRNSLIDLYKMYVNVLDSPEMQLVLDVMEEVDASCWVLDPEKPMRRDLYRRIVVGKPKISTFWLIQTKLKSAKTTTVSINSRFIKFVYCKVVFLYVRWKSLDDHQL